MKYTSFEQEWDALRHETGRCPLDDAELSRRVRCAVWTDRQPAAVRPLTARRRPWRWVAAAVVLLVVAVPVGLHAAWPKSLPTVTLDGDCFYFVCNRGCQADETTELLNLLIH